MISTKGRYSLRILIDLAKNRNGSYIPMKDVAKRQGISLKYIERLLPALKEGGLIESLHGKGGGYRLCRSPEEYSVGEILNLTESASLTTVACLGENAQDCPRASACKTLPLWAEYNKLTHDFFYGKKLSSLLGTH